MIRFCTGRGIVVVAVVALVASACSSSRGGSLSWTTQVGSKVGGPLMSIPTYTTGPSDGSGWSTQPLDQPRPVPGRLWKWSGDRDRGACQWLTPDLLEGFGWTGEDMFTGSPPCVIPVAHGRALQILPDNVYESFSGPVVDPLAFMRAIRIEGLEAREYNLISGEKSAHGSCVIEVNTRSLTSLNIVVLTADGAPPGTDPAPQCELGRRVATLIVHKYVPLTGGTPWPRTPQHPEPQRRGPHQPAPHPVPPITPVQGACDLVGATVVFGFIEAGRGQPGTNGPTTTTCTYSQGDAQAKAWHAVDLPGDWRSTLPALASDELAVDSKLGVMPARVQLTRDGRTCSEAVEYSAGQVFRISYQNSRFTPEILCRIAEQILGNVIARMADRSA